MRLITISPNQAIEIADTIIRAEVVGGNRVKLIIDAPINVVIERGEKRDGGPK